MRVFKLFTDLVGVFSWDKSFKKNLFLGNYWLNFLGLHVVRVSVAHLMWRFRLLILSPLVTSHLRRQFIRDGVIVLKDVLEPKAYRALREAVLKYSGRKQQFFEGATRVERIYMPQSDLFSTSKFGLLGNSRLFKDLMRWTSSKNRYPISYVENLTNHCGDGSAPDPQRDVHSDSFHPCVKGWFYLDGADENNGPFCYVRGSNRLTWKRVKWEWRQSLLASRRSTTATEGRYWDGSFRVTPEDLDAMGLRLEPIDVPENSLVIANVFGFHCRGEALAPSNRLTLWFQMRDNPFNPIPALMPSFASQITERIWLKMMNLRDAKRVRSGELELREGRVSRLGEACE